MRRSRRKSSFFGRLFFAVAAIPLLYLGAALIGSLVPVNAKWAEPERGTTVYLRSNGIHIDIIMPAKAVGLDWRPLLPAHDFAAPPSDAKWFAFGTGERRVYLDTPRWRDLKPPAMRAAILGGPRLVHVERLDSLGSDLHPITLRPDEYRRLWAAVRASFALDLKGKPHRIHHPGYENDDAFYEGVGTANALATCNQWVADRLRLAGVRTGVWTPFAQGLLWRYPVTQ